MVYFASKGLFVREIGCERYVIQDVFGNCSLPITCDLERLDRETHKVANVTKLVSLGVDAEYPDLSDFLWNDLESHYVAHVEYSFLRFLLSDQEKNRYHSVVYAFPVAYLELGYGDGSKSTFEFIHNQFSNLCKREDFPVNEADLVVFLVVNQVRRICSDIMSLVHRAITAYVDLLRSHRECVLGSFKAIEQLNSPEIIHRGKGVHQSATAVTSLVISLCSSMDLSAKLIQYINSVDQNKIIFKPARDRQFHEIRKLQPRSMSGDCIGRFVEISEASPELPELVQFRNDLIHSTSAIELEKIYVGCGTEEVNGLHLYYSAQYARDSVPSGQPVRFLGRDYFTEEKLDIEVKALSWLKAVIKYHIEVGANLLVHLNQNMKPNE